MLNGIKIKIAGIVPESIVDGPGFRYTVFTQGCPHKCEGCHNPHTHSYDGGNFISVSDIISEIKKNPLLDGITFSGGEPFEQANALHILGAEIRKLGLNVITYTGYTLEYLVENADNENGYRKLLSVTDILKDGRFEQDKKTADIPFIGSENQRIIDVRKSLEKNRAISVSI